MKESDPAAIDAISSVYTDQLSSLEQEIAQLRTDLSSINSLKEQATQQEEKKLADLSTLILKQFDDKGEYENLRYWIHALGGTDAFSRAMKTRCSLIATKGGVPAQVAKAAIIEHYPDLEAYL